MVTQQIGHLEKRYRDSIVAVDDKIIAIEFKSPSLTNCGCRGKRCLKYYNINFDALISVASRIHPDNTFLALIHAYLNAEDIHINKNTGLYLWYAVPATTAFIPLSHLLRALRLMGCSPGSMSKITATIYVLKSRPHSTKKNLVPIPTCFCSIPPLLAKDKIMNILLDYHVERQVKLSYCKNGKYVDECVFHCCGAGSINDLCESCGGLFSRRPGLKQPVLDIDIRIQCGKDKQIKYRVKSFTLASLIFSIASCRIGYTIGQEDDLAILDKELLAEYLKSATLAILRWGRDGLFFVPLSIARED